MANRQALRITIADRHIVRQPIEGPDSPPVALVKEIVHIDADVRLAMVRKHLPDGHGCHGALLLTHGFGQNRYAWHLPGRSFVNHLAAAGWDVFNLDLRGHGRSGALGSRPCASIDEYIGHDLPAALEAVRTVRGEVQTFLLGHSLGGLVGYAAVPSLGDRVAGLVTLGAPYAFGRGNPLLLTFTRVLLGLTSSLKAHTRVPMRWVQEWFRRQRSLWDHPWVPLPVRAWHPKSIEPRVLDEYLRLSFDRATFGELATVAASGTMGRFASEDGSIDYAARWEATDLPVLIFAGTRDLLAPEASVWPAFERSAARDKTYHAVPLGHADLLLGREAPRLVWSVVTAWLARRAAKNSPR
jgi:alpha-beta hydrolase superfamily lysophospholipase